MSIFDRLGKILGLGNSGQEPEVANSDYVLHDLTGGQRSPELNDLLTDDEGQRLVLAICTEACAKSPKAWDAKLSDSTTWIELKSKDARTQAAVLKAAAYGPLKGSYPATAKSWHINSLRHTMVSQILRRNLPFAYDDLLPITKQWVAQHGSLEWGLPAKSILNAIERLALKLPLSHGMFQVLEKAKSRIETSQNQGWLNNKFHQEILARINALLDPSSVATAPSLLKGPFGDAFRSYLDDLDEKQRNAWIKLGLLAAEAGDKSKPTAKWNAAMQGHIKAVDPKNYATVTTAFMGKTVPDPAAVDVSQDILKGLIWGLPLLDQPDDTAGPLGRFVETCFRKVPNWGARSVKLGNAGLYALSAMTDSPRAAAEMFRLRTKIKYPSAKKLLDARLEDLATASGQDISALEDLSLPDFGLSIDGTRSDSIGDARVELALDANKLAVNWFGANGKPVKSVPQSVKTNAKQELAEIRQVIKDIEAARSSQAFRLEQSWVDERDWPLADWTEHFLNHPLRRLIVTALVWRAINGNDTMCFMADAGGFVDSEGKEIALTQNSRISLWHPLHSQPDEVLRWRQHIINAGITQPIKQTHREIYVLTDAERNTATYSNRFAAHIIRQHQFRALCQARGWEYQYMGGWDSWNVPARKLPKQKLTVEYQVAVVDDEQRTESWIPLHLATDQVRFIDADGRPIPLETIDPIIFSEMLRDVDLFVAVTSIANDPQWTDGGPEGRNGGYWRDWAFGDLGQSASTRKELIAQIAPKLSIADKLEITDKFLVVQGKRQKYAIHFGSSNIQILPNNRYLCIVPDRPHKETEKIRLPFAGDNLLSIILSKAFMLVDEDKIKDETILRQL